MWIRRASKVAFVLVLPFTFGCGNSVSGLIEQLNDPDPATRLAAVRALAAERANSDTVVPALDHAVADADSAVREAAITALGGLGSAARPGLPALEQALGDSETSTRVAAALAIQRIDPASESQVSVLIEALRAGHGPVFLEVGRMGTAANWAVPTLVELLTDRRPSIRALAAVTLGEIGPVDTKTRTALKHSLRDDNPAVRRAAERACEIIEAN